MSQIVSKNTFILNNTPTILSYAAIVGKKEGEGPLKEHFDLCYSDTTLGKNTWEKAESELQKQTVKKALQKAKLTTDKIDLLFGGDLLNQCIGSAYSARELNIPFLGLYGACSTMAESLGLASIFIDNNLATFCCAVTSSHFCSAERQFRFPLEYGGQRTPTSQWTVTGSGCAVVTKNDKPPFVRAVSFGTVIDLGICDINNMGAAMAPAAANTIKKFFCDTKTGPMNYSKIITGDLGMIGSELLITLLREDDIDIANIHDDCGKMIFSIANQDVHAGGSGCGCSASVLCSYILKQVKNGIWEDVLFVATGALMSPTSVLQGESIPAIAHLVHISSHKR